MGKPNVLTMPSHRPEAPRGPACVRVNGVRCRCRECGDYLSTAHVVHGVRGAFCSHCCPACNPRPPLPAEGGPDAA
jgi:hypothetical protein